VSLPLSKASELMGRADLQDAATTVHTESGIFKQIMPMTPAAPPSANRAAGNWVPPRMSTPPSPSSAG
jgi:hypothetical protein